jgi:hypothetical protein
MSKNILTVASLPGVPGLADWGRLSRAEIIKRTREMAAHEKAKAEKILSARDEDFNVRVVEGVHKQKLITRL